MIELRPCPFCGRSDVSIEAFDETVICAACNKCGAIGPAAELEEIAAERWNRRPKPVEPEDSKWIGDEFRYRVIPHVSGTNERFDFALLDPNGLVKSRCGGPSSYTLDKKRDELQEAFDIGFARGRQRDG